MCEISGLSFAEDGKRLKMAEDLYSRVSCGPACVIIIIIIVIIIIMLRSLDKLLSKGRGLQLQSSGQVISLSD